MHIKKVITAGTPIDQARGVVIMLHGRGATAEDILTLSDHLHVDRCTLLAPQATNYTWYPYSFMAPVSQNEPWLTSALDNLTEIVREVNQAGIKDEKIIFAGFSQGACLTLEYITRHARRWGGAVAFTGGLIGEKIYYENYQGDFAGTPVFIGTSDPDPHVPVSRVEESARVIKGMNAHITTKIYPALGHTIASDEIKQANQLVFDQLA